MNSHRWFWRAARRTDAPNSSGWASPFRARAPALGEEALKSTLVGIAPGEFASRLAAAKAASLEPLEAPGTILIGCDQVAVLGSEVLGKPGTTAGAIAQLARLAGRSHALLTALAVRHGGHTVVHVDRAVLTMRALSPAEIERYVAADRPEDCAGAYKLEQRGIALFERVEADDPSAITGLPLIALTTILRGRGWPIP